jgi:NTP pyrophosphatase (non-canonical NTP hydrolase)
MINKLWQSTKDFHGKWDFKALTAKGVKRAFLEEVDEVIEELEKEVLDLDALCEEMVDVLVTLLGICIYYNISLFRFSGFIDKVCNKNDAKNHETHYLDKKTSKITRR